MFKNKIILLIAFSFLFISSSCEDPNDNIDVPWWVTGSEYTFTPTSGGSVEWFSYRVTNQGAIACNSTGETWETFNGYTGSNSLSEVTVTLNYPDNAWEKFVIKSNSTYEYTGKTSTGFQQSHTGRWKEGSPC